MSSEASFKHYQKTTSTRGAMEVRGAAEPWPRAPTPKEIKNTSKLMVQYIKAPTRELCLCPRLPPPPNLPYQLKMYGYVNDHQ